MEYTRTKYDALRAEYEDLEKQIKALTDRREQVHKEMIDYSVHISDTGFKYHDSDTGIKKFMQDFDSDFEKLFNFLNSMSVQNKIISLVYILDNSENVPVGFLKGSFVREFQLLEENLFDIDSVVEKLNNESCKEI